MKAHSCSSAITRIMLSFLFVTAPFFSPYDSPDHSPFTQVESYEITLSNLVAVSPISKFAKDKQERAQSPAVLPALQHGIEHTVAAKRPYLIDAEPSGRTIVLHITRSMRT